jgi:transcriptional regulator with XRE-family HTH domain
MSASRADWVAWSEIHQQELTDPEARAEWERTALARAVAVEVIRYRSRHGLTQTALAELLGMRQPAVSRLELGETNPSWETLVRLSDALGIEFLVDIAPAGRRPRLLGPELKRAERVDRHRSRGVRVTIATR